MRLIAIILVLLGHSALAQHTIEGRILDYTNLQKLGGAKVSFHGQSTISDSLGHFKLSKLSGDKGILSVQLIGYDLTTIEMLLNPI